MPYRRRIFDRFQVPDSHTRIIYDKTGLYHAIQRFKETVQRTEARHRRRHDGSSGSKRLYHGPTRERTRSRAGGVCRSETLHFVRQRYGRAHPRPESMEHRCGRCRIRARLHFLLFGRGHLAGRGHTRFCGCGWRYVQYGRLGFGTEDSPYHRGRQADTQGHHYRRFVRPSRQLSRYP